LQHGPFLLLVSCLGSVSLAGFEALAAGLGALLAVVVLVLAALVGALLADFDAFLNNVLGVGRITGDEGRGKPTDIGTVAVGADARGHHPHVVFAEAGVGAVFAGGYAAT
jgi:cytochrome bd-type quinol oxidase subunit 1